MLRETIRWVDAIRVLVCGSVRVTCSGWFLGIGYVEGPTRGDEVKKIDLNTVADGMVYYEGHHILPVRWVLEYFMWCKGYRMVTFVLSNKQRYGWVKI